MHDDARAELLTLAQPGPQIVRSPTFALTAAFTAILVIGAAHDDPVAALTHLLTAWIVALGLPFVMTACLAAATLSVGLFAISCGLVLRGRLDRSALELAGEANRLPLAILPGLWRAVRRVRSPRWWGFGFGLLCATVWLLREALATPLG